MRVGLPAATLTGPRPVELGNTTLFAAKVEYTNDAFAKVTPAIGVQLFIPAVTSTPDALNVALICKVVPKMFVEPATVAPTPIPPAYTSESDGFPITTPLVTVRSANCADNAELLLVYVPVIVAGPCQPLPMFTETFPVALKVSAHTAPIVQVALKDAPGSATFKPGNGTHSELLLNAAANVLVLPLRAIEPVIPDTGSVKPENGDQLALLPVLNARLNEY